MRIFYLNRKKDVSGVSGVGIVAEGVEFHDGQCVISWFSRYHSVAIYPCIEDIMRVHGHDGSTEIVFSVPETSREERSDSGVSEVSRRDSDKA